MTDKARILVIDDSQLMLFALNEILGAFYEVHCFEDASDALKRIDSIMPSLILIDVIMPKISGFEVLIKLKATPGVSDIPVIMMTNQDDKSDSEELSFKLGAADFIPKPFKPPVVVARVRSHVSLYEYHKELESTVITDALTGIYNRRGFDEFLEREWKRGSRDNSPLTLLMLDIDHFKLYNDNYGHQAGDNALQLVGQALKYSLHRMSDIPARYGGEEFGVILPDVGRPGAAVVAKRLNDTIQALGIKHEFSPAAKTITVSIGGATAPPIGSPEALIKTADTMLYKAKASGRNQFCQ